MRTRGPVRPPPRPVCPAPGVPALPAVGSPLPPSCALPPRFPPQCVPRRTRSAQRCGRARGPHGKQRGHGEPRRGGNSLRTAGPDVTHRSRTASRGQRRGVGTRTPKDKGEVPLCGGGCGLRLRFRRLGAMLSRGAPVFSLSKTGGLPWVSPLSHPKRTAPAGHRGEAGPGPTPALPKKFFDGRSPLPPAAPPEQPPRSAPTAPPPGPPLVGQETAAGLWAARRAVCPGTLRARFVPRGG